MDGAAVGGLQFGERVGALVLGGHFHGLSVIRELARRHIPVVLLDHEPCMARWSRYLTGFYPIPSYEIGERLLSFLFDLGHRKRWRGWVLYPTDDEGVFFLSRYRPMLIPFFRVAIPDWEIIQFVYDKHLTYQKAEVLGIPIPRTRYPQSESDLGQMDLPSFPLVLKPAVMRRYFLKAGHKALRVDDRESLLLAYRAMARLIPPEEILIQEWIPHRPEDLMSFCPFVKQGKVLGRIVARRPRQHPMDFGHASTFAETIPDPGLEEIGLRFLNAIGYEGLCEVEFIRDGRDGIYRLLEVNPRIWGWYGLAERAGVPLVSLMYCDQIGQSRSIPSYRSGMRWIRLLTDLPTAWGEILHGHLGLGAYGNSLWGVDMEAVWCRDDPVPFFAELFMAPYLFKKRGF